MLEEWDISAQNLLEHFRTIIRGHILLCETAAGSNKMSDSAKLDTESRQYLLRIQELLKNSGGLQLVESYLAQGICTTNIVKYPRHFAARA
jgi:hypothetical protein